jgi:hypothetical protein
MAGRRSPCKIESSEAVNSQKMLRGLAGRQRIDRSRRLGVSAFMDSEQFGGVPNRPSDLDTRSANAVTTYLWTVAVAAEPTSGRAPFCLQADGEIRKQTGKRQRSSGCVARRQSRRWDDRSPVLPARAFEIGDQATNTRARKAFHGNNLEWIYIKLFKTYTPRRKGWTGSTLRLKICRERSE